ncbi:unnamed protein product [Symbiodinium sp. CCMP2456]|nr:unnamed protein product [Symbiodinium sp. CCMP2456]
MAFWHEAWEKAVEIWHEMISEGSSTPAPDAASAALTIRGCSQGSSWQASVEVFRQAKAVEGLTVSSSAYNAVLYAVAVGRSWGGALALLEEMAAEFVPMTRSTRNAALRACTLGVPKQEALWASTRALALLREHGLKTSREAWEAEGLPAHAELTEAGLNFAASRVELLLLNMEGEEASGIDFDEGPRRPMLAGTSLREVNSSLSAPCTRSLASTRFPRVCHCSCLGFQAPILRRMWLPQNPVARPSSRRLVPLSALARPSCT